MPAQGATAQESQSVGTVADVVGNFGSTSQYLCCTNGRALCLYSTLHARAECVLYAPELNVCFVIDPMACCSTVGSGGATHGQHHVSFEIKDLQNGDSKMLLDKA